MTEIVVGLDGSRPSELALGWALELAKGVEKPIFHLVHACDPPIPHGNGFAYGKEVKRALDDGQGLLDKAAAFLEGIEVHHHLSQGSPAFILLDVAEKVKADLIAVGRRGLSRTAGIFLGSVSTDVLHRAHAPVLVVHDGPPRPIQRVMVGIDGSYQSSKAVAFAARWAPPDARLTALHVEPAEKPDGPTARDVLYRTARTAEVSPSRFSALNAAGNAAEQVVFEYRSGAYDLAVVGSRGLGTLRELLLGSVSERLVRLANGPVVVAK